jgi:hypothetical protein
MLAAAALAAAPGWLPVNRHRPLEPGEPSAPSPPKPVLEKPACRARAGGATGKAGFLASVPRAEPKRRDRLEPPPKPLSE